MIKRVIKVLRKIEMLNNQRKLKFEVIIKDRIPRIKVQEKHEKQVRWAISFQFRILNGENSAKIIQKG